MEVQGRVSRHDGMSLRAWARGKSKRKTRENMEHFVKKMAGSMMKRQEKMHNQRIKVMEYERILLSEEAWRQHELERHGCKRCHRARLSSLSSKVLLVKKISRSKTSLIPFPNNVNQLIRDNEM